MMSNLTKQELSPAALRKLLELTLPSDGLFQAFCIDYFPAAAAQFSGGMSRTERISLLYHYSNPREIFNYLIEAVPERVKQHITSVCAQSLVPEDFLPYDEIASLLHEEECLVSQGLPLGEIRKRLVEVKRRLRQGPQLHPQEVLVERYVLITIIGHGGFADVWKAFDRKLRKFVAIKVLHSQLVRDMLSRDRFYRGARRMAPLNHPHIVTVLAPPAEDQGFHFFVMEYQAFGDLRHAILDRKLTREQAFRALLQVGDALTYAHTCNLVHRDVKPQNILLANANMARLTDFDLVMGVDTTGGTRTGAMGTFIYASPEEIENAKNVDLRSDIYSLAMTMLFVLNGKDLSPRVFKNTERFIKTLNCPAALKAVLKRATIWEREKRYDKMSEFCDAIQETADIRSEFLVFPAKQRIPTTGTLANGFWQNQIRNLVTIPIKRVKPETLLVLTPLSKNPAGRIFGIINHFKSLLAYGGRYMWLLNLGLFICLVILIGRLLLNTASKSVQPANRLDDMAHLSTR